MNASDLPFDTCLHWQRQRIAVLEQPLVEVERSFSWKDRGELGWQFAHNKVLVCPRCLDKWGFLDFGKPMLQREPDGCLSPVAAFCGRCGEGVEEQVPGSILNHNNGVDLPLLYALPLSLLEREFQVHLQYYEKGEHGADSS